MLTNLKILRNKNNMSQKVLGTKIGISQQSINKYENHDIEPDIETLKRMSVIFDTSIDYIVGNSDIDHKIDNVSDFQIYRQEEKFIKMFRELSPSLQESIYNMTCEIKNCNK